MNSAEMVAIYTGAGAIGAAVLGLIGALVANSISASLKERELFQSALEYLTGGTQKRSVGIALMTRYAEANRMKEVVATIFEAQMLHLRDEGHDTSSSARKIEYFNYSLMQAALRAWGKTPKSIQSEV